MARGWREFRGLVRRERAPAVVAVPLELDLVAGALDASHSEGGGEAADGCEEEVGGDGVGKLAEGFAAQDGEERVEGVEEHGGLNVGGRAFEADGKIVVLPTGNQDAEGDGGDDGEDEDKTISGGSGMDAAAEHG